MTDNGKNPVVKDDKILLKEAYRYISEYLFILEYHDKYSILDKDKIDRIKRLKDEINNTVQTVFNKDQEVDYLYKNQILNLTLTTQQSKNNTSIFQQSL